MFVSDASFEAFMAVLDCDAYRSTTWRHNPEHLVLKFFLFEKVFTFLAYTDNRMF
jgi:hypothetical protein